MNIVRCRLIVGGNYTDYEIKTKDKSESCFEGIIKRELDEWGIKPLCYRFDMIVDGVAIKSRMSYPIIDERFL